MWMNPGVHVSEISQPEEDKDCMLSLTVYLKKKGELIVTESKMVVTRGWGWEKRGDVNQHDCTNSQL